MSEDKELQSIRDKKLRELTRKTLEKLAEGGNPKQLVSSKPTEVTDETLDSTVRSQGLVVVDCWAPWCAPCRMLSPIVEELARDYAGKIFFGKLNIDENPKVAMRYEIMSIPTLLVFKNGKLVDRLVGAMPRQMLEPKITRHL
jgi:thioredoxin 1